MERSIRTAGFPHCCPCSGSWWVILLAKMLHRQFPLLLLLLYADPRSKQSSTAYKEGMLHSRCTLGQTQRGEECWGAAVLKHGFLIVRWSPLLLVVVLIGVCWWFWPGSGSAQRADEPSFALSVSAKKQVLQVYNIIALACRNVLFTVLLLLLFGLPFSISPRVLTRNTRREDASFHCMLFSFFVYEFSFWICLENVAIPLLSPCCSIFTHNSYPEFIRNVR